MTRARLSGLAGMLTLMACAAQTTDTRLVGRWEEINAYENSVTCLVRVDEASPPCWVLHFFQDGQFIMQQEDDQTSGRYDILDSGMLRLMDGEDTVVVDYRFTAANDTLTLSSLNRKEVFQYVRVNR